MCYLSAASNLPSKAQKGLFVVSQLRAVARSTQAPIIALLQQHGVPYQSFYIVNMIKITQFEALLAPIPPQPPTSQTTAGKAVFENIGCNVCHMESFTTQQNVKLRTTNGGNTAVVAPLSNVTFSPYSDFLLHDMGSGDSGGIPFLPHGIGQATLTMWRTAPLWGLSNILVKAGGLMHDNGSKNIDAAIRRHGGEAATVITNYNGLNSTDSANLLAFLGSL